MSFIADLHTHSPFSRATSPDCALEKLHAWAQIKGVRVVGAGDFTHPERFKEMRDKLVPSLPGLYRLKPDLAKAANAGIPDKCRGDVDFMITGEISSIYKRDGVCRKVHSLLLIPDMEGAAALNARLGKLGNIKSDGRPIMGLDPRVIIELLLETSPEACLIPAHIWTPWFSMLGSKSGFDSPFECFGDMLQHVFAAETGLSSDPPMNWRVGSLDNLCLVSNSDLHSPANLARNANLFLCDVAYPAMLDALKTRNPKAAGGTIDMFPEEGKYHCDGHRKCGVCLPPEESMALDDLCPKCGKPLVLGVLHRVEELADRPVGFRPPGALPCEHIIPLPELLGEILGCAPTAKRSKELYDRVIREFGPELFVLRETEPEALERSGVPLLAEAVRRVRVERVIKSPGYDGEYGAIRVFEAGEKEKLAGQSALFAIGRKEKAPSKKTLRPKKKERAGALYAAGGKPGAQSVRENAPELTWEQNAAASETSAPVIITAGPGAGKTRTLISRITALVSGAGADPASILAVTFTNRAASEMRARLDPVLGEKAGQVRIRTFHSFCLELLRARPEKAGVPEDFTLIDQDEETELLKKCPGLEPEQAELIVVTLEQCRRNIEQPPARHEIRFLENALQERRLLPLDEVVPACVKMLRAEPGLLGGLGLKWICVDEYQDVNRAQYELVRLLAPHGEGLFVIGDPDQAIYGFRGSDAAFFLRFADDFPGAKIFTLKTNFRSTASITNAAGQVMAPGRTGMSVRSEARGEPGVLVAFHTAETAAAEAAFIAHETEKLLGGAAMFSMDSGRVAGHSAGPALGMNDVAVLVRLRALMPPLAEALRELGLPVQIVGHERFADTPGARAAIRGLRNAGRQTLDLPAALALAAASPPAGDRRALEAFEECRALAAAFQGSLREFLDALLLRMETDRYDRRAERINILTFHAAKGLEFPAVFIAGCEDGIVPHVPKFDPERADRAEERRLLYVAMTRAMKTLYLCSARKRALFGEILRLPRSPFLDEIESGLFMEMKTPPLKRKDKPGQMEFAF